MTLPTARASDLCVVGVITGKLDTQKRKRADNNSSALGMALVSGHVYTLAVDPEYRRRGVASQLMAALEIKLSCHAVHQDCILGSLMLEVQPKNSSAIAFYDRNAFYQYSPVKKGYYGGLGDAQEMRKVLV